MPTPADRNYEPSAAPTLAVREGDIEFGFPGILQDLKYDYRLDIRDRASLEQNFREKFEALNRCRLSDSEFARLLDELISSDVFTAAKFLREINDFTRDDGTPLNYSLVNCYTKTLLCLLQLFIVSNRDRTFLPCVPEDGANLVARTYPIAFSITGKTWVNNHAHVLRFEQACTQKFVEPYLNSIKLDDYITGMAQPKLNEAMLDRIPIPHPRVPEQHRIAECLSSLDALITAETQKHTVLQRHKRGLMQQLFPSPQATEA